MLQKQDFDEMKFESLFVPVRILAAFILFFNLSFSQSLEVDSIFLNNTGAQVFVENFSFTSLNQLQRWDTSVVYKSLGWKDLSIHIFTDKKYNTSSPCILFTHGGGWRGGNPEQYLEYAKYYSDHGFFCASVEYRLLPDSSIVSPYDEVEDIRAAIRFLRENYDVFRIDTNKIIAVGSSAGGHLVASAAFISPDSISNALSTVSCLPNALVLQNPVFDLSEEGWEYGHNFLGNDWLNLSPLHHLDSACVSIPSIVLSGSIDPIAHFHSMIKWDSIYKQYDAFSQLYRFDGRTHGFSNYPSYESGENHRDFVYNLFLINDFLYRNNFSKKDTISFNVSICPNETFAAPHGGTISDSGTYVFQLRNQIGSDSTVFISLGIRQQTVNNITETTCLEQFIAPDGQAYQQSGTYTAIIPNTFGCDSIITIYLTFGNSSGTIQEQVCSSYTAPDGQIYTASGQYTAIIPNSYACDSLIQIDLIVHDPTYSSISETACLSYIAPDNQIYTQSGTYTAVIPNAAGCDSIITIDLTISNPITTMISEEACMFYTAPDGQLYTSSGVYEAVLPNSLGCDSTILIDLLINQGSSTFITESSCGSYTAPDGQLFSQSGTYTTVLSDRFGCDSIITINLTINQSSSSTINKTECNPYTAPDGQVYTSNGTYTVVIPNASGCDSIITTNLTLTTVNTSVQQATSSLFAVAAVADSYQWIDCSTNLEVTGANLPLFSPEYGASYAVVIAAGGCTDTSACFAVGNVALDELEGSKKLELFPNPVSKYLNILSTEMGSFDFQLVDLNGRLLVERLNNVESVYLDVENLQEGLYIVRLLSQRGEFVKRFTKI